MYIQKYKIFENVRQAKKFLADNDIDRNNEYFLRLKDILKKNPGYLGKFTEWFFEDYEEGETPVIPKLSFLNRLYREIKEVGLDKDINQFKTAEDLYDHLTDKKINTRVNQTIKSLPSRTRRLVNDSLKELIKNNIKHFDNIKDFYSKKGGRYTSIDNLIRDTKSLISKKQGGWSPDSIDYEEDELVYKDEDTLILWIEDYDRSCELGSEHWCISTDEDMFQDYTSGFKKQYFIYDFTKDIGDKKSMIGVTIDLKGDPTAIHYKDDTEGNREDIKEYMEYLKPYSEEII